MNVRLDMDELDLTAAESKAAYEEIKKYAAEHYDGMKVSNLYVVQVKQKHGMIERENSTNVVEPSDIGNKNWCSQAFCLQKNFSRI